MSEIARLVYDDDFLCHHGVKDQKHGVRRWQYPDGSLTPEGRIHYGVGPARESNNKALEARALRDIGDSENLELACDSFVYYDPADDYNELQRDLAHKDPKKS